MAHSWKCLLRRRGEEAASVTSIELFFDLAYAAAITELTHHLLLMNEASGRRP
jgi:low temperature requirement protein LtrA